MDDLVKRCLAAARECHADPSVVRKAGYPTREDFESAIAKLAWDEWDKKHETYYVAYKRAIESVDGQTLYYGREMAPPTLLNPYLRGRDKL
jgi:hypothetical protein